MFAVIRTGGKQYKVTAGDVIKVEKVAGEVGAKVQFSDVLAITNDSGQVTIGSPTVSNASVTGIILEQGRDEKVIIFKKKRRHNYRRKKGHRQEVTWLRVREIKFGTAIAVYDKPERQKLTQKVPVEKAKKSAEAKASAPKEKKAEGAAKKAPAKKTASKKKD